MKPNAKLYQNPQEIWDTKKCTAFAKRKGSDGYGTPDPFPGWLKGPRGPVQYNGGCIRDGEWFDGENFPLPTIPKEFKWEHILSWGWRLVKL